MSRASSTAASSVERHTLVVDPCGVAQEGADLAPVVGGEVAPHAAPEVGRLADVEHPTLVGRGRGRRPAMRGRRVVSPSLAAWGWRAMAGQPAQVVEAQNTERRGSFEEEVQEVRGGERVVEGPVARAMGEPEAVGERAETAVGHLVTDEAPGERGGVDDVVGEPRPLGSFEGGLEESDVEADVVPHDDGVADELQERGEHGLDARGAHHHASVMPVRTVIVGGMARPGFTSVWNVPRHSPPRTFTAPTSVIVSVPGAPPVVSRSTTTNVVSTRGCPRSSRLAWRWVDIDGHCVEQVFDCQGFADQCRSVGCREWPQRLRPYPVPLHRVRQPHPLRRDHDPSDPGVPPLLASVAT